MKQKVSMLTGEYVDMFSLGILFFVMCGADLFLHSHSDDIDAILIQIIMWIL